MTTGRPDARGQGERAPAFAVEIRRASRAGILALERVLDSDLADLCAEALWKGAARRGRPDLTLEEGVRGPLPADLRSDGRSCAGVTFSVGSGAGAAVTFPRECFAPVAHRAAARLVAAGVLQAGDEFTYSLSLAAGDGPARERAEPGPVRARAPVERTLPAFERCELAPLLARARPCDAEHALADDHAVVLARTALERARTIAERGLARRPPLETGGVLLGRRVACPRSGEAYVVVEEALEAESAIAAEFSLEFSSETWRRFEGVLRRRSAHAATASQLLVGQFHVHPFLPDGGLAPCADCARRATCSRSSARPSAEDARWCRAVFHEAPWQLSLMFGLDARGERRTELYGQRGGALARRGYHLLDALEALPFGAPAPPSPAREDPPCPTT
jgi:hypothetical protein